MKMNVYLNFNGKAEEAFKFYRSVFGGKFQALQRFKDVPPSAGPQDRSEEERIMHIALPIGEDMLFASDISEKRGMRVEQGNNVFISLHPESLAESRRIFGRLSDGGSVEMGFQKMFWGAYYGALTDRFGVKWMVNFEEKKEKAPARAGGARKRPRS